MADLNHVLKVRAQRVRKARAEADRCRHTLHRAEAAALEARDRQRILEQQAELAGAVETTLLQRPIRAADIQQQLAFVAGLRTKVRELGPVIRRADLVRGRAQETAEEANIELRREVLRHEAVAQVVSRQQVEQRRILEASSEQAALDERAMHAVAARAWVDEVGS